MRMTGVGISYGNDADAFALGRDTAAAALRAGGLVQADVLVAFCSGHSDAHRFHAGLRSVVGEATPIIGGSSLGVITNEALSYQGHPAAVAAIRSDKVAFRVAAAGGLDIDEVAAGRTLARGLARSKVDKALYVLYDSIRTPAGRPGPPVLNASAPLLAGIEEVLTGDVPILGAGLLGEYGFGPTWQFDGRGVVSQHVVACLISGDCGVDHAIMHGCIPLDGVYRRITRMQGDVIHELDGRPLPEIIDELFGNRDWRGESPVIMNLTLGVNCGDRFGPPRESQYVNRLLTGVTLDGDGVGMFEADLAVGQEVQFMVRDNRMMLQSVRENAPALVDRARAGGRRPFLALYISCGGRTAVQSRTEQEEAAEVQRVTREAGIPLLGIWSGVEIAPLLGRSRGLDWTGVLVILSEGG
jgi:hypothetical protein